MRSFPNGCACGPAGNRLYVRRSLQAFSANRLSRPAAGSVTSQGSSPCPLSRDGEIRGVAGRGGGGFLASGRWRGPGDRSLSARSARDRRNPPGCKTRKCRGRGPGPAFCGPAPGRLHNAGRCSRLPSAMNVNACSKEGSAPHRLPARGQRGGWRSNHVHSGGREDRISSGR